MSEKFKIDRESFLECVLLSERLKRHETEAQLAKTQLDMAQAKINQAVTEGGKFEWDGQIGESLIVERRLAKSPEDRLKEQAKADALKGNEPS